MILKKEISKLFTLKRSAFLLKLAFTLLLCAISIWQVKEHFSSLQITTITRGSFSKRPYFIGLMFLMSFLNWLTESIKWKIALPESNEVSLLQAFKGVLMGLGVSLLLPRLAGETIGRYGNHKGDKKNVFSALVLTKIAQSFVTVFFGIFGVYYFKNQLLEWFHFPNKLFLVLFTLSFLLLYLFKNKIVSFLNESTYLDSFKQLSFFKSAKLLLFSFLRYFTFYGQFIIMCLFLEVEVDWINLFFALATLYFVRTVTISVNIVTDLTVRFATALFVFSTLNIIPDSNQVLVLLSLVWLFNVLLPSFIGGVLIMKKND